MAERLLLNTGASVELRTDKGVLSIAGNNAVTRFTEEQYKAAMKKADFKTWVEKGFIIVDVPLLRTNDVVEARKEADIKEQEETVASIKVDALSDAIMANEGVSSKAQAKEEAKKRLSKEASKAKQAGDKDAAELEKAANA